MGASLEEGVRRALELGWTDDEIVSALHASGWSNTEIKEAIRTWYPFRVNGEIIVVPCKQEKPKAAPRADSGETLWYALLAVSLGGVLGGLLDVAFAVINRLLPPAGGWYTGEAYGGTAALIVATPVFLTSYSRIEKTLRRHPERMMSGPRKWILRIILFLASVSAMACLANLISGLLYANGDANGGCKVFLAFTLLSSTIYYFAQEVKRNYVADGPPKPLTYTLVTLVLIAIVAGVFMRPVDPPRVEPVPTRFTI